MSCSTEPQHQLLLLSNWCLEQNSRKRACAFAEPSCVINLIRQHSISNYKALTEELSVTHKAYAQHRNQSLENATPEQYLERARLAVNWGEHAMRCAILMLSTGTTVICLALCTKRG
jgi:hypothetical protein